MILRRLTWMVLFLAVFCSLASAVPVEDASRQLNMQWKWDSGDRILLTSASDKIQLCPNMSTALVNGRSVKLAAPVGFEAGAPSLTREDVATLQRELARPADPAPVSTRTQPAAAPAGGKRFQTVMIDAGHGGKFIGTANNTLNLAEKTVTLQLALELRDMLQAAGLTVILTRDRDMDFDKELAKDLGARSRMANEKMPDFFISIHADGAENSSARGFHVLYDSQQWERGDKASVAARRTELDPKKVGGSAGVDESTEAMLYRMIFDENIRQSRTMAETMVKHLARNVDDQNRGVKTQNLHVTREVFVPSVLVEAGFLTHLETAKRMQTAAYRTKIARSLSDAILEFKADYDKSQGFSN